MGSIAPEQARMELKALDNAIWRMLHALDVLPDEEYGHKHDELREAICGVFRDRIQELEEAAKPILTESDKLFNNFRIWRGL